MSEERMGAEPTYQLHGGSSSGDEDRAGGSGNGDGRSSSRSTTPEGRRDPEGLASDHVGDERDSDERSNDPSSGDTGTGYRNVGTVEPESDEHLGMNSTNDSANGYGTPLARPASEESPGYRSAVQ